MKNLGRIVFLALCMGLCLVPFVGMLLHPSDVMTENKELAKFPQLKEQGRFNVDFLQELGAYFEDHFALRPLLVTADARIQSGIFGVSNVDTVVCGKDGWLYYTATIDDFLGRDAMSEREAFNAACNLALVQRYVQKQGASFLFTVAPNKNSLYGAQMPDYLQKAESGTRSMDLLLPQLTQQGVAYTDLFALFSAQQELLYLKRDSHWNRKGAVLVYDALLDALEIPHDSYEAVKAVRQKDAYGDLNKMLYPLGAEPEWEYEYQKEDTFSFVTETESVEDAWIETKNPQGEGSLLMFRDSFGNTLLPLMANTFAEGYFSRSTPMMLERSMEQCQPQTVIVEKVERNIEEFAVNPPIVGAVETKLPQTTKRLETDTTLTIAESENDPNYWKISGRLAEAVCEAEVRVLLLVTDGGEQSAYEAFCVSDEESDYGYCLYLKKESLVEQDVTIAVLCQNGEEKQVVYEQQIVLP